MRYCDLVALQDERSELLRAFVLGDESVKPRLDEVRGLINAQVEKDCDELAAWFEAAQIKNPPCSGFR